MKVFICKKCQARFSGSDIVSKDNSFTCKCPKCGAKDFFRYEDKGIKKREWKSLGSFMKDNIN